MSTRIGKFDFLNNYLPYYWLEQNGTRIIEALPKTLARMFEEGKVDFTPVSSFYYLKNKVRLASYDFCLASKQNVLSVVVVSNGNTPGGINGSIAVTNQTTTSVNLLKIILRERGLKNKLVLVNASNAGTLLKHCNHALLIGDEAIKARMKYRVMMDLGEEWRDLTGYPMVFGIAISRKVEDMRAINRKVKESVEWGKRNVDVIITEAEKKFGLPAEFLERYFKTLTYRLGAEERRGLELFEKKCHEYGLL